MVRMQAEFRYVREAGMRPLLKAKPDLAGFPQKPSKTILPRDLPLSIRAWARLRLTALIVPRTSASVVLILPASISLATRFRSSPCADISAVSKVERVNIASQWTDRLLRLKGLMSRVLGSSISANRP